MAAQCIAVAVISGESDGTSKSPSFFTTSSSFFAGRGRNSFGIARICSVTAFLGFQIFFGLLERSLCAAKGETAVDSLAGYGESDFAKVVVAAFGAFTDCINGQLCIQNFSGTCHFFYIRMSIVLRSDMDQAGSRLGANTIILHTRIIFNGHLFLPCINRRHAPVYLAPEHHA